MLPLRTQLFQFEGWTPKTMCQSPRGGGGQGGAQSCVRNPEVTGSVPGQGTCPCCGFSLHSGHVREAAAPCLSFTWMFPFLFLRPLALSKYKYLSLRKSPTASVPVAPTFGRGQLPVLGTLNRLRGDRLCTKCVAFGDSAAGVLSVGTQRVGTLGCTLPGDGV